MSEWNDALEAAIKKLEERRTNYQKKRAKAITAADQTALSTAALTTQLNINFISTLKHPE